MMKSNDKEYIKWRKVMNSGWNSMWAMNIEGRDDMEGIGVIQLDCGQYSLFGKEKDDYMWTLVISTT